MGSLSSRVAGQESAAGIASPVAILPCHRFAVLEAFSSIRHSLATVPKHEAAPSFETRPMAAPEEDAERGQLSWKLAVSLTGSGGERSAAHQISPG
jgi:hypothetical protein